MTSSATPDVIEALRAKPAALSCFEALSPSHRNEYLKWIAVRLGERHGLVPLGQSSLSELAERAQTRARAFREAGADAVAGFRRVLTGLAAEERRKEAAQ